jgi:DNA-binding NarL/FixJ family response regulator
VGVTKRLLIVDDDPRFRALIRQVLEGAAGFEVVGEAHQGSSALEAARELRPDVVLLDVNLPDTTGFELAPQLAAGGNGPAIVLTSSRGDETYVQLAADAGASGFVSKFDLTPAAISSALS